MAANDKLNLTMLCDFYEFTMGNGYFAHGYKDRICYFDVFFRKCPDNGGFAIAAGLEQIIDYIKDLHFTAEDIEYLRSRNIFTEDFLEYLKDFQEYNPNFPNIGGWRQKTYFGRKGHPYITHSLGPLHHIMQEKIKTVSAIAAGHSFDMVAENTCGLMLETDKGHVICLRSSFVSPRPDQVTYYSFQGNDGCYQAPKGPTDYHKIFINGVCDRGGWNSPGGWKNVYDFTENIDDNWKRYWNVVDYKDSLDNDTYELYDSGALMMLEDFADCVLNNKPVPVSFADAANWTAAGLISADSVNCGGKPLSVPSFE